MTLLGHGEPWRVWRAALGGGRLHHAWLLAGSKGLGKASFAAAAAGEMLALEQTGPAPRQHPDIIVVEPLPDKDEDERKKAEGKPFQTRRNITIEQVRAVQRRLTTRPTLGSRRAVIVDAADHLEPSAANALLKSLEEPPHGTVFLLVSHRPGRLMATIRSRCRMLRFHDLADGDIGEVLDAHAPGLAADARAAAIAGSAGSPGAALEFVARDLASAQRVMTRLVKEGDRSFALRAELAAALGARPERERMRAAIDLARCVLVRAAAAADRQRQARMIEAHAALGRLSAEAPTFNYDPGLLVLQIGGFLASAAPHGSR
jgi:DNA polymerase III subunit delta'